MDLEIKYLDKESMQLETMRGDAIEDQLDKLKQVLEYALKEMSQLGNYTLNEFTAKVGIELGAWILTADGSVTLRGKKQTNKAESDILSFFLADNLVRCFSSEKND